MKCQRLSAAALWSGVASASLYGQSPLNHTCVLQKPTLSCSAEADAPDAHFSLDSCCTETFGGLLLSTQFWSTYTGLEADGQLLPPESWTLHGLWPDFCNGSYTGYCDFSRQYDPVPSPSYIQGPYLDEYGLPNGTIIPPWTGPTIEELIAPFGKNDLIAWMNKYWINQGGTNDEFWAHEFAKHATCFSTFDVPCYGPEYVKHEELVDFFETAIMYDLRLPTYTWLENAGITPSNSTRVSLSDVQDALTKGYGKLPYVGCSGPRYNETDAGKGTMDNGRTQISETWYYFHSLGRPQEGKWVPLDATGFTTSCAKAEGALLYPERAKGSEW